MDLGVFIPIGSNGWLISTTSPRYQPSFALNRDVTQLAERYGFEFALSMVKLRGFGGESEFWDHCLESFTLMAGDRRRHLTDQAVCFPAVLTLPPAIVARMASTIDGIAPGRFGINIVSGWQAAEYSQMGLWPGNEHFSSRYEYSAEYVQIMRELWTNGQIGFQGQVLHHEGLQAESAASSDARDRRCRAKRHRHGVRRGTCRLQLLPGRRRQHADGVRTVRRAPR